MIRHIEGPARGGLPVVAKLGGGRGWPGRPTPYYYVLAFKSSALVGTLIWMHQDSPGIRAHACKSAMYTKPQHAAHGPARSQC